MFIMKKYYFIVFFTIIEKFILIYSQTMAWIQDPQFRVNNYEVIVNKFCGKGCYQVGFVVPHSFGAQTKIHLGATAVNFINNGASFGYQLAAYELTASQYKFYIAMLNETVIYRMNVASLTLDGSVSDYFSGYGSFNCQILSKGQGYRSQNYSMSILASRPYYISQNNGIILTVYPLGYTVFNPSGSYLYLNWKSYINKTHYTVSFQTNQKNIIPFINFNIVAFDSNYIGAGRYVRFVSIGSITCPGTNCMGTGGWNPATRFQDDHKQFWGMSGFNFTKNQQINWFLNTTSYANMAIGYTQSMGITEIKISGMIVVYRLCLDFDNNSTTVQYYNPFNSQCVLNCTSSPYFYQSSANFVCDKCHYTCLTCNNYLSTACTSCSAAYKRSKYPNSAVSVFSCLCVSTYVQVGASECKSCESYMPGCDTCGSYTYCYTCKSGLQVSATHKECLCSNKNLSLTRNGRCADLRGCISLFTLANSSQVCIECAYSSNFALSSNFTCECNQGYQLSFASDGTTYICVQTCGNSKLTTSQFCDDGNSISGDGCSNLCKIEDNYICYGNYLQKSFCLKNSTQIVYYGAEKRWDDEDIVDSYFSFSPWDQKIIQNITLFRSFFISTLQNNSGFYDISYKIQQNNKDEIRIILSFKYSQKINKTQNYRLKYQISSMIQQKSHLVSINFSLQSKNYEFFTPTKTSSSQNLFAYTILICIIIGFIVAFISIFSLNWIGIQLMQTFQLFYLYFCMMKEVDSEISYFLQMLKYFFGFQSTRDYTLFEYYDFDRIFYRMRFSKQFIQNFKYTSILFIIPIALLIAKGFVKLYNSYCKNSKVKRRKKLNQESPNEGRKLKYKQYWFLDKNFIIRKVTLFLALVFLLPILFYYFIQQTSLFYNQNLPQRLIFTNLYLYTLLLVQLSIISLLIFQCLKKLKDKNLAFAEKQQNKLFQLKRFQPWYPIISIFFNLSQFLYLTTNLQQRTTPYVLIGINSITFLTILIFKPYQRQRQLQQTSYCYTLHNLHNIWNSLSLIGFLIIIVLYNSSKEQGQIKNFNTFIMIYVTVTFLISLVFGFLRLFLSKKIVLFFQKLKELFTFKTQQNIKLTQSQQFQLSRPKITQKSSKRLKQLFLKSQIKNMRKKVTQNQDSQLVNKISSSLIQQNKQKTNSFFKDNKNQRKIRSNQKDIKKDLTLKKNKNLRSLSTKKKLVKK